MPAHTLFEVLLLEQTTCDVFIRPDPDASLPPALSCLKANPGRTSTRCLLRAPSLALSWLWQSGGPHSTLSDPEQFLQPQENQMSAGS